MSYLAEDREQQEDEWQDREEGIERERARQKQDVVFPSREGDAANEAKRGKGPSPRSFRAPTDACPSATGRLVAADG